MQVIPALPWDKGAGGQIKFSEPISIEDLLVGRVKLGLDFNGEVAENVRFYRAPNSDTVTVMSGGSTVFGVSLNNNTLTLNYIYQDDSYNLESVELVQLPAISTYPSLPWATTLNEGVIKLESPITFAQIRFGALAFMSTNNSWFGIGESETGLEILYTSNIVVYKIAKFDGSTNIITLQRNSDAPGISLKAVVQYYGETDYEPLNVGINGGAPVEDEESVPVLFRNSDNKYMALTQDGISAITGITVLNDTVFGSKISFSGQLAESTKLQSGPIPDFVEGRLIYVNLVFNNGQWLLHYNYPPSNQSSELVVDNVNHNVILYDV